MKVNYTGKLDRLSSADEAKLERRYAKLAKLLDKKTGEREVHVILNEEKRGHEAEITVLFADHQLVSAVTGADQFSALTAAIDKMEKQILKLHDKRIAVKRTRQAPVKGAALPIEEPGGIAIAETHPEVLRVNGHLDHKPMTLDEAILELDSEDFVVYRDAETDRVSVLVRQKDGRIALVEA